MTREYSDALSRFRDLIKRDNRRINSKKREKEKLDLLDWYVDNCPAQDGPETAKRFADYNIKSNYDYKRLKSVIIDSLGLKKDASYRFCETGNDMEALIEDIEKVYSSKRKATIYFSKGRNGEMDSLFIRIRNSFAHGNYFKVRDYYYLWNETNPKGKPKKLASFMVLKYSDLKSIYNALSTTKQM